MRASLIVAVVAAIVGFSAQTVAQAAIRKSTSIPPQALAQGLRALMNDREFQIIYSSELLAGRQTQGAVGELTMDEALTQLLSGTGLTYRYVDEKTVTIVPMGSAVPEGARSAKPPSQELPSQEQNNGDDQKKTFWDQFRVAQVDQGRDSNSSSVESEISRSPDSSKKPVAIEEIVVTAQKRPERLIDVPQSVSVLSADYLAKLGATQFRDFANTVPGLTFATAGAGYTQISLRGVTAGFDVGSTVGIYVDEVPFGSSGAFANSARATLDPGLFEVERIEVLRGPQGTLYGASSMGGLIKYVAKMPDTKSFTGHVQAGLSNTQNGRANYDVAAAVNAPIVTERIAIRASGFESHDGGYINNVALAQTDVNRSHIYGGRLDLLFTPNDALTIRIAGLLQNISRDGQASADYSGAGVPLYGSLDQSRKFAELFDQRVRLVSGTASYDLNWGLLTSISSYQTTRMHYLADVSVRWVPLTLSLFRRSYSAVGLAEAADTDKFTQEVRLGSEGSMRIEWVIGGFYNRENSRRSQNLVPLDLAGQAAPLDLLNFLSPSRYEEYAEFGDLTWHITKKFSATGGLRYASSRQKYEQIGSGFLIGSRPETRSSEDVVTYLANARYQFNDHATAYTRYATGYRPGGPNFQVLNPATGQLIGPANFEADRLKSYEIGFKGDTADRRFGIDLAVYYIDWKNIQILAARGGLSGIVNASSGATVRGAELALTARPVRAFAVSGTFAYQDAQMSEADADLKAAKGERLPSVPHFTAALNADYDLAGGNLQPTVGMTLRYVGDRTTSFNNSAAPPQYRLPEYATVDLRAGFVLGSVNTQLYVHNLFDNRGQLLMPNTIVQANGPRPVSILQPRTIGVAASTQF